MFDGNTRIGFNYVSVKCYCKRCKILFKSGFNSCNDIPGGEECPNCKKYDKVETDMFIDKHIDFVRMCIPHAKDPKKARNEVYELMEIKGILDEYD